MEAPQKEVQLMIQLYDLGHTYSEIGKAIGRSRNTVSSRLRRLYPDRTPRSAEHIALVNRFSARRGRKKQIAKPNTYKPVWEDF